MSLVKVNEHGRIRESWLARKSTNRLEVILRKLARKQHELYKVVSTLNNYNLNYLEAHTEYIRIMQLWVQLRVIIIHRHRTGEV